MQQGDLAIIQLINAARVRQYRRNIRCNKIPAVTERHNQGARTAHTGNFIRVLLIEDAERVRTFQLRNCQPDRFQKITRIVLLQQMCDHLCIGFRGEDTALRLQLCLQCRIIFDNPIVYNRNFPELLRCG